MEITTRDEVHVTVSYFKEDELGMLVPSSTHPVWARVADCKDKTPQVSYDMYTCIDIAIQQLQDMVESNSASSHSRDFYCRNLWA